MNKWLYFKIYAKEPRDPEFHERTIANLVVPLFETYSKSVCKFMVTQYRFRKSEFPEEEYIDDTFFTHGIVAFLRVRLLIDSDDADAIRSQLISRIESLSNGGGLLKGYEEKPYDVEEDIGKRIGLEYMDSVIGLLDNASRLRILLVKNDEYNRNREDLARKIVAVMHLSANTLDFAAECNIRIGRMDPFIGRI